MGSLAITHQGELYLIGIDSIPALTSAGLSLVDDGGNLGVHIVDGGGVNTGSVLICIGDTSNANMTVGLTINQGAYDNEILAFKSSDVAHGVTNYAETDTYGLIKKLSDTTGGMSLWGFNEVTCGVSLISFGLSANITKSTSTSGFISLYGYQASGVGITPVDANANLLTIHTYDGAFKTVFLVDEDGDLYIGGSLYSLGDVDTYITFPGSDIMTFYTGGVAALSIDAAGQITKPKQPAFSATMSADQDNIVKDGVRVIIFNSEIFDLNADYNPATYTFTAPVTGKYHLSVVLRVDTVDTASAYYGVSIVTSNRIYTDYLDPNFTADLIVHTFKLSVVADMDASDIAYVTIYQDGGTDQADIIAANSYFMGYLLG
jgi:hypothetical protein